MHVIDPQTGLVMTRGECLAAQGRDDPFPALEHRMTVPVGPKKSKAYGTSTGECHSGQAAIAA